MPDLHGWDLGSTGAIDFEARLRNWRFARCVLRAEAAIESGARGEARVALDEARELIPDASALARLEARMIEPRHASASSVVSAVPDDLPLGLDGEDIPDDLDEEEISDDLDEAAVPTSPLVPVELVRSRSVLVQRDHRIARPLTRAALTVVLLAVAGVVDDGPVEILMTRPPQKDTAAATRPADTQANVGNTQGAGTPGRGENEPPPGKAVMLHATAASIPAATPAVRRAESAASHSEPRTVRPRPPSASDALPAVAPAVPPPSVQEEPAIMPAPVNIGSRAASEPVAPAPPFTGPVGTSGARVPPRPDPLSPPAAASRSTEVERRDDDTQIRAVLRRYESAYNRLGASAVNSLWPTVNSGALDHAFKGLVSQRISLGSCDIMKIGDKGLATCVGKAAGEPRVDGDTQTAQRYWAFDLRRNADGWRIEQVRVK